MNESQLRTKVMLYLRTLPGCYARKIADRFSAGYPDIWGCYHGCFFAIELKIAKGRVSEIQKYEMDLIDNSGGSVAVCRSLNEVKEFMETVILKKEGQK